MFISHVNNTVLTTQYIYICINNPTDDKVVVYVVSSLQDIFQTSILYTPECEHAYFSSCLILVFYLS